ncbi:MAG: M28 family peptidase [Gemmatimonadaceae bacterium]|nr:M28 family peptidase [Gemmatimonadaceae bacterium]
MSISRFVPMALAALVACERPSAAPRPFDGAQALEYVRQQLAFGPRVPGTEAAQKAGDWIVQMMRERADTVIEQRWTHVTASGDTVPMRNILARYRPELTDRVLYVAHWDSRPRSENASDTSQRHLPVPGANDGASGVALLIALGDLLVKAPPSIGVDFLFTDGEDYGTFGPPDTDVLVGAAYFAEHLPSPGYRPLFGVLWDMIGDRDLSIGKEGHSVEKAGDVVERVWRVAGELGYGQYFTPDNIGAITDDHVPLLAKGLPVIDVIDLAFPWHHTPDDTIDKVSSVSLKIVGDVAWALLSP